MMESTDPAGKIRFQLHGKPEERALAPRVLERKDRATDLHLHGLQVVTIQQSYDLSLTTRAAIGAEEKLQVETKGTDLLAIETADGFTLFIRADKLQDDLRRIAPEALADGVLDIDNLLVDRRFPTRGLSDWLITRLSVLTINDDGIIDAAVRQAMEWLGDKAKGRFKNWAEMSLSRIGTKALTWVIEQHMGNDFGLRRWTHPENASAALEAVGPEQLLQDSREGTLLVFIHGTASSTLGSFGDLAGAAVWPSLRQRYGNRIYGFEHRTFSESPIENALGLANLLPANARINLVTHSRGGLVGDLISIATIDQAALNAFKRRPGLEELDAQDRSLLQQLRNVLQEKNFHIDRYLRVAAPARGTRLISGNLDAFLSGLLKLVGLVPALCASPLYSAFTRIVLEIARNRTDPKLIPGIEAMMPESPLTRLLATSQPKPGLHMAVIAGDIEGGGLLKRLGVFFTDWMFFDSLDNDLVVDTDSMFTGLARPGQARYIFEQGPEVTHFRYFTNMRLRLALQAWLTQGDPALAAEFTLLPLMEDEFQLDELRALEPLLPDVRGVDPRPIVFVIPGIMGSHLTIDDNRIWFDFFDLTLGGLGKIRWHGLQDKVMPEKLFEMFYGDLCRHLRKTHRVEIFPYDWRKTVEQAADLLAQRIEKLLEDPSVAQRPVRLLAHSMGGIVVRAMIARHGALWTRLAQMPGTRVIMLGTPNQGSHSAVETLLGKEAMIRKLACIDTHHGLQGVLDIVADFRGLLQLLPRPGFLDTALQGKDDYYDVALWQSFKAGIKDLWFGDGTAAVPDPKAFAEAKGLWEKTLRDDQIPYADRIGYVFGCAPKTPCAVVRKGDRLKMLGTPEGDGTVTWASGRIKAIQNYWYMPASHGQLADTPEFFPAIVDLLQTGTTSGLSRQAPRIRGAAETIVYDAGPVPYPTSEELGRSVLGASLRRKPRRTGLHVLNVRCEAKDLRFARYPVMCGHCEDDAISAAEAVLDQHVVGGALRTRHQLGLYAGAIGSATVVLLARNAAERRRGDAHGAVILGLGKLGDLNTLTLVETVRSGVLRYLLTLVDRETEATDAPDQGGELGLTTLLVGRNSTTHISIEDSVYAILRGVCEANCHFESGIREAQPGRRKPPQVSQLEFVELFLDNAVTATRAIQHAAQRLEQDLAHLAIRITPAAELAVGDGVRMRLDAEEGMAYWPRLVIAGIPARTEVDRLNPAVAPAPPVSSPEPAPAAAAPANQMSSFPSKTQTYAEGLRFTYLSKRARAESERLQPQPGLVEKIVEKAISDPADKELSRTLFHLLVPREFREMARQTDRIVLVLDDYTANLPWEMVAIDHTPLVLQTAVVRQLDTAQYRTRVRSTLQKNALVVGDPSTAGFIQALGLKGYNPPPLPGAAKEAALVAQLLAEKNYQVEHALPGTMALEVFNKLFKAHYRIMHIAAHGAFDLSGKDGRRRSGVLLSDGMFLTAYEIGQLDCVPDLVFINCCFGGKMAPTPAAYNKLAYGVARELIDIGVRAVVAAGWAVDDGAALIFAEIFYRQLLEEGQPFGLAVLKARQETYRQFPACNTWGAYQAYGDPEFTMDPASQVARKSVWNPVFKQELVERIDDLRHQLKNQKTDRQALHSIQARVEAAVQHSPAAWRGLPEVHYALGRFHAELGPEGFEKARAAYLQALLADNGRGKVPMAAIEQLANLEARTGERRGDPTLVTSAIERLEGLLKSIGGPDKGNPEQLCLLASAYKRKAVLALRQPRVRWAAIEASLKASIQWYGRAERLQGDVDFDPYPVLNRLALEAVVGMTGDSAAQKAAVALARRCCQQAERRFANSCDFFDALMTAEALLAEHLQQETLSASQGQVIEAYLQAAERVLRSERHFDSAAQQLRLLADFFKAHAKHLHRKELALTAEALEQISIALTAPAASDAVGTVADQGLHGKPGDKGPTATPEAAISSARRKKKPKTKGNTKTMPSAA